MLHFVTEIPNLHKTYQKICHSRAEICLLKLNISTFRKQSLLKTAEVALGEGGLFKLLNELLSHDK